MLLLWPSAKVVQFILIRWKTWPPCRGVAWFFLYVYSEIFENYWNSIKLGERYRAIMALSYVYRDLLVPRYWLDLKIIWHKCFLDDPLQRLFKYYWSIEKHDLQGAGLFPLYVYIYKVKNLKNFHMYIYKVKNLKNFLAKSTGQN